MTTNWNNLSGIVQGDVTYYVRSSNVTKKYLDLEVMAYSEKWESFDVSFEYKNLSSSEWKSNAKIISTNAIKINENKIYGLQASKYGYLNTLRWKFSDNNVNYGGKPKIRINVLPRVRSFSTSNIAHIASEVYGSHYADILAISPDLKIVGKNQKGQWILVDTNWIYIKESIGDGWVHRKNGFSNPTHVYQKLNGNYIVADYGNNKILELSDDLSTQIHSFSINSPTFFDFDENNETILVTFKLSNSVKEYSWKESNLGELIWENNFPLTSPECATYKHQNSSSIIVANTGENRVYLCNRLTGSDQNLRGFKFLDASSSAVEVLNFYNPYRVFWKKSEIFVVEKNGKLQDYLEMLSSSSQSLNSDSSGGTSSSSSSEGTSSSSSLGSSSSSSSDSSQSSSSSSSVGTSSSSSEGTSSSSSEGTSSSSSKGTSSSSSEGTSSSSSEGTSSSSSSEGTSSSSSEGTSSSSSEGTSSSSSSEGTSSSSSAEADESSSSSEGTSSSSSEGTSSSSSDGTTSSSSSVSSQSSSSSSSDSSLSSSSSSSDSTSSSSSESVGNTSSSSSSVGYSSSSSSDSTSSSSSESVGNTSSSTSSTSSQSSSSSSSESVGNTSSSSSSEGNSSSSSSEGTSSSSSAGSSSSSSEGNSSSSSSEGTSSSSSSEGTSSSSSEGTSSSSSSSSGAIAPSSSSSSEGTSSSSSIDSSSSSSSFDGIGYDRVNIDFRVGF